MVEDCGSYAGNETGRMIIVNGFNPGSVFFRDTVAVQPNTNYLFTAWIMNLFKVTGYPNPELSVRILMKTITSCTVPH